MISVAQAKYIILQNTQNFDTENISFLKTNNRVLKEDIVADRDFPPFNRVAMDGIAINYRFFKQGVREFKIEGIQPAGSPQKTMENATHCYEVMTGAVLPNNCDTVIRYEDIKLTNGIATVLVDKITQAQNIHPQGKDKKINTVLISKNTLISPAEIGVLATVGKTTVKVAKQPKILIISTGDELIEVNEKPAPHQIRRSNAFTLTTTLQKLNILAKTDHITDNKETLTEKIKNHLQEFDALLFSGAVSKGKFDFLPEVLKELGVQKLFHRVTQRPGKPFWMGQTNTCKIFAFPGNPVSTFVNCLVYFYWWYCHATGNTFKQQTAILTKDVIFKPNLTYFLQVQLENKNGQLLAHPIKGNGSGDLASLVNADGFLELPKTKNEVFKKETVFPVIPYR